MRHWIGQLAKFSFISAIAFNALAVERTLIGEDENFSYYVNNTTISVNSKPIQSSNNYASLKYNYIKDMLYKGTDLVIMTVEYTGEMTCEKALGSAERPIVAVINGTSYEMQAKCTDSKSAMAMAGHDDSEAINKQLLEKSVVNIGIPSLLVTASFVDTIDSVICKEAISEFDDIRAAEIAKQSKEGPNIPTPKELNRNTINAQQELDLMIISE